MSVEITGIAPSTPVEQVLPEAARPPRLWPAVILVALFWLGHFIMGAVDKLYFYGFLYGMAAAALLTLAYFIWWWTNRRIRLAERFYGFAVIVGVGAVVGPFCHPSIGVFGLLTTGLPFVLTIWTVWQLLAEKLVLSRRWLASLALVTLSWGCFTLVRVDGVNSDLQADVHWRWTPSAEDLLLAEKAAAAAHAPASRSSSAAEWSPVLSPGDWPGFRGPNRDGVVRGFSLVADWRTQTPRQVWRQRVGPAWSSVAVIGDRLFTQEQRGEQEMVVCYDATTGQERWIHEDRVRFWETVSGAGPRATPTFADGRLFTLGGTGILNCLDAATGKCQWSRDITADAGSKPPMWGFSGSPLVVDSLVIAFAGGDGDSNLLAYRVYSGELAWTAPAGPGSYSSPRLATLAGQRQCLMLSEYGLTSVDPATGAVLWKCGLSMPGAPRVLQPQVIGESQLVVGTLQGPGVARISVSRDGNAWKVDDPLWNSTQMKPEFPDFVVHEGHAYGFDVSMFCCLDLATGKRCWKEGRYGRGQVVLLADSSLLLVQSESGEVVLLAANPERHEERGRFQALKGKTWNHPVVAHGQLYVRNAEEMACYELNPSPK
jgi:outer membrane protein assembly factor BamB